MSSVTSHFLLLLQSFNHYTKLLLLQILQYFYYFQLYPESIKGSFFIALEPNLLYCTSSVLLPSVLTLTLQKDHTGIQSKYIPTMGPFVFLIICLCAFTKTLNDNFCRANEVGCSSLKNWMIVFYLYLNGMRNERLVRKEPRHQNLSNSNISPQSLLKLV